MQQTTETSSPRHRVDADGILRIVFDGPSGRVNLLDAEVLRRLAALLDDAKARTDIRAVMFSSAKPGMFLAGIDVEAIAGVRDAQTAAEGARFGQSVFQRIADLGKPAACAIAGTCLGGGTELALACSLRVAADDAAVSIGLPEVRLGIIPGFGGSQRLPRLIGLAPSLELILSGRAVDAGRARTLGLVDRVVPLAYLERETLALIRQAVEGGGRSPLRKRKWTALPAEKIGPLRRLVLDQARRRTEAKISPADYPAPFRALEAIEAAMVQPLREGLDLEARIVGELASSATSKNLIWLFQSQNALKGDTGGARAVPRKVRRAAVVGAGVMGGGIARLIADGDVPVRLKDVRIDSILAALRTADGIWHDRLKRGRISRREIARKLAHIAPTLEETGFRHVDLVIEAVVEDLQVKRQVLASLEPRLDERAVFATNTSSLPVRDIASECARPERVVGLHFFNPVHRMPLVEIIPWRLSSPEAVVTVHEFVVKLGKIPVIVKDGPGFLVNRVLAFYLHEAMRLLLDGVRVEALDAAMTAFGMPLGPMSLLDRIGLDTARQVQAVLQRAFAARLGDQEPSLDAIVASGRQGEKNARGFYRYRRGRPAVPDAEIYNLIGSPPPRELPPETLQERMVLAMVNEAARCLQERVAREARDVDVAMVTGTGFPPFRGGVLRHADSVGIPIITDRLSRLSEAHGERFRPAEILDSMVRGQRRFFGD